MIETSPPTGYIKCNGELMAFKLPDDVNPETIGIDWVPA